MIGVRIEKSRSRSGKHAIRSLALLVSPDGSIEEAKPTRIIRETPIYINGDAYRAYIRVPKGWFLAYIYMIKNLRGRVRGFIEVYSDEGILLYKANYNKLKLRRSTGDPKYAWIIRRIADYLKLFVKNTNLGDE